MFIFTTICKEKEQERLYLAQFYSLWSRYFQHLLHTQKAEIKTNCQATSNSAVFASLQSLDSCLLLNNKVPLGACSFLAIMWSFAALAVRRLWNSSSVNWLLQRKRSAGVGLASKNFWREVPGDLMEMRPTKSCLLTQKKLHTLGFLRRCAIKCVVVSEEWRPCGSSYILKYAANKTINQSINILIELKCL